MSSATISWLPAEICTDGDYKAEVLPRLYAVFQNDIKCGKLMLNGLRICYFSTYEGEYEGIFWHLISKDQKSQQKTQKPSNSRLPDSSRAAKISWIKPLIEHHDDPLVKCWDYLESNRKIRTYLWLEQEGFLVILEKARKKNVLYLITAFYVAPTDASYRRYLQTKWIRRII